MATGPNQLWSWDITKLRGPVTWTFYYLYVILDVFSRYVVGWMIAYRETAALAKQLVEHSCRKQEIAPGQVSIHADRGRGSSMTSKALALLMADLGVLKTSSRPQVSDDNPFSEARVKTMKYRPDFPDSLWLDRRRPQFLPAVLSLVQPPASSLRPHLMTPAAVHHGRAPQLIAARQAVLDAAWRAHPERFVKRPPQHRSLPNALWINPPAPSNENPP